MNQEDKNLNIIDELKARGMFNNITSIEKFNKLPKGAGLYIGFDPTAESLHLGNYIQMTILRRFKEHGFSPVAILGGATGMIGDPSGKSEERNLLSQQALINNKNKIRAQLEGYGFKVIDNLDFYAKMNVLDFLREVGKYISVSHMINKDTVKSRLETGISYTEFSYQIIQGWDFKCLYTSNNVFIQVGGSDQWGNITTGIEMIRKTVGEENLAMGITTNLLTTASGKKFGKSEGNAIWIDKNATSSFSLYQYLLNTPDEDIEKLLKWITFLTMDEIKKVMDTHVRDSSMRLAQKIFAEEVVTDIHGAAELEKAQALSGLLFGNGSISSFKADDLLQLQGSIPTFENIQGTVRETLLQIGAASSNRELMEFLASGAIEINGEVVTDGNATITRNAFEGKLTIIRRGKKKFFLIKYTK